MSRIWYTSDLHLGHRLVAQLRGFDDNTTAHDMTIMDKWIKHVHDDDQVWVLGDLAMSERAHALNVLGLLPGRKHLIAGNHDACHPMHRGAHKHHPTYLQVFESVQIAARRRIAGTDVLLSHFPYAGTDGSDHTPEDRHTQWRLPDHGAWLLHGHTHNPDQRHHHGRQIHVGLDAWDLTPVPQDGIAAIITETEGSPS